MTVYYDKESQFDLTEEEFIKALPAFESGKNVWIERLKVHLTPFYKWAGEKPKAAITQGRLHDGTRVIKRFGEWKDVANPDINLDPSFYPEIARDEIISEEEYANAKLLEMPRE